MDGLVKLSLRMAAGARMRAGNYDMSPLPTEPTINRRHIDGPYLRSLDGQIRWLSPWERLAALSAAESHANAQPIGPVRDYRERNAQ